jgi:WD40 repeat protein
MVSSTNYQGIYLLSFPDGIIDTVCEERSAGWGANWSHSGKYIAARVIKSGQGKFANQVVVYDPQSKKRLELSSDESLLPGTPFWTNDDNFIYLSSTDRLRFFPLKASLKRPRQNFAFVKNDWLFYYDAQTQTERPIACGDTKILAAKPSPDGNWLALEKFDGGLTLIKVDGSQIVEVGQGFQPSWSPDSKFVCYTYALDNGHNYFHGDLWITSVDGKVHFALTTSDREIEMSPCWSPDGKWLAYTLQNKGIIMVQELELE